MTKFLRAGLMLLVLLPAMALRAQKVKLEEGDLSVLKGEQSIAIEFTYDPMAVGKFDKESDYVKSRTDEINKKNPGKGDAWAKAWVDDRQSRFEPKFLDLFEKYSPLAPTGKGKYTIIFHTTFTEVGFNIGVMRRSANINGEALIVETANKSHVIAKIMVTKSPGRDFWGADYDTGARLEEAYATAGRGVARLLKDKL